MNLGNMELFTMVYELGSIAKAADKLYTSHQSISKRIKSMEDELGVQLFERSVNGLKPTKAGKAAYRSFEEILVTYNGLTDQLAELSANRPLVRALIELYNADVVDTDALLRFEECSELGTRLELEYCSNDDCYRRVLSGQAELAFTNRPLAQGCNFELVSLKSSRSLVALSARNPLSKKQSLTLEDLGDSVSLDVLDAQSTNKAFAERFAERGIELHAVTVSYDVATLSNMVRSDRGFHICPDDFAQKLTADPGIVVRPLPEADGVFEIGIVLARKRMCMPETREFIDYVTAHADEIIR